jgi:hypothetical protein
VDPEVLTVSPAKFANGTYHIYHDFVGQSWSSTTEHPNSQYLSRLIY